MQTHTTLIAAAVIAAMAGCVHAQTYSLSQGTQTIENDVSYVGDSDDRFAQTSPGRHSRLHQAMSQVTNGTPL